LGWIFFRSGSLEQIRHIITKILTGPYAIHDEASLFGNTLLYIFIPLTVMTVGILREIRPGWFSGGLKFSRFDFLNQPIYLKSISYGAMTYLLCFFGATAKSFIYFQF
jgi:hypothetical protein